MIARVFLWILVMALVGCASQQEKALIEAAGKGDVARMRHLIDQGADVNAVALDDWTPLTRAASNGRIDAVRLLIASGADINKGSGDLSPLILCSGRRARRGRQTLAGTWSQADFPGCRSEKISA